jgi:hypothetical protein
LHAGQELLLGEKPLLFAGAGGAVKDAEELLKSEAHGVLDPGQVLAALSDKWVDEALVHEGHIDSLSGHEVDKVLERALKFAMVGFSHIGQNPFSFALSQLCLQSFKNLLKALDSGKECRLVLELSVDYGLKSQVQSFEGLLHFFEGVVELLSLDQLNSLEALKVVVFGQG